MLEDTTIDDPRFTFPVGTGHKRTSNNHTELKYVHSLNEITYARNKQILFAINWRKK